MPDKWSKYAQPSASAPAQGDKWSKYAQPAATNAAPQKGFLGSFADASGLSGIPSLMTHPIDTLTNGVKGTIANTVDNVNKGVQEYKKSGLSDATTEHFLHAIPILGPAGQAAEQQMDNKNYSGVAGTLAGTVAGLAGPEAMRGLLPRVPSALATSGEALRSGGAGVIDKAAGMLKADFKHGANPGMGYLEGGGTPAINLRSLANKAQDVQNKTGAGLRTAYSNSSAHIPTNAVADAVSAPFKELESQQNGFGGTGVSPQVDAVQDHMQPALFNAGMRGGFTPLQLFDEIKKPLAANTKWNDPAMFDLNSARQQATGAVGGLLTDAVPEAKQLNKIYQGSSKLASRAELRANTGTPPFASIVNRGLEGGLGAGLAAYSHTPLLAALPLALDSVAAKTGLGYGMYKLGNGLGAAGDALSRLPVPSSVIANGVGIPANALIKRPKNND